MASQFWTNQTTANTTSGLDITNQMNTFSLWGTFGGAVVKQQASNDGGDNWIDMRQFQGPAIWNEEFQVVATNRVKVRFKLEGAGTTTSISGVHEAVA